MSTEEMDSENIMDRRLLSFSWNHDRKTFFNTVYNLRKQEVFCDVTLACDGALFPVHRLVLAMCSEFFNEILTKAPSHPSMVVLVPTVSAEDMEALLTYIYVGEIRISQAKLPSLMKAAHTLKIKGLCNTSDALPWEQYANQTENEATSEEIHIIPDIEGRESDSHDSIMFQPPYYSPEEPVSEPQHLPQLQDNVPEYSQVEVFVNNGRETYDMMCEREPEEEEEEKEEEEEAKSAWMQEEVEEVDPLSMPLDLPNTLAFSHASNPPDSATPHLLPLETIITEDSEPDSIFSTTSSGATSSKPSPFSSFRYTNEQRYQILKDYHTYGPCKAAKVNSVRFGRKINESSVRSIVRSFARSKGSLK